MNANVEIEDWRSSMIARVATVLRDQGMPPEELQVVLTTSDPELIRRHLELHMERLQELLDAQRRSVAEIVRILDGRAVCS